MVIKVDVFWAILIKNNIMEYFLKAKNKRNWTKHQPELSSCDTSKGLNIPRPTTDGVPDLRENPHRLWNGEFYFDNKIK